MGTKTLINTTYLKEKWKKDDCNRWVKEADDCLIMVIKDNETNRSEIQLIERPTIDYYVTKDRNEQYPEMFIDENKVIKRTVDYANLERHLLTELGLQNEFSALQRNTPPQDRYRVLRQYVQENVYNSPYIYMADVDIEDYYKTLFLEREGNNPPKRLNKSYFDIETWIYNVTEKVDQNNPITPITMISYINTEKKTLYGLLLDFPNDIPKIAEIRNSVDDYLNKFVWDDYKDEDIEIKLEFYDTEPLMIRRFFQLVQEDKPDFCMAWNSNYDIKYLLGRIKFFKMDPVELFCHPDIPDQYKRFNYREDSERHKNSFNVNKSKHHALMWDWVTAPGYTVWIDQMSLYANLRKRTMEPSYKLNSITQKELHIEKVQLADFGVNIRNAIVKDYEIFLKYSLKDTFLLHKLEEKGQDCELVLFLIGNTKLEKGLNISYVIKNAFLKMFREKGLVIGNTVDYGIKESISGALVADPTLINIMSLCINDKPSHIYQYIIDLDAASLYPSIMIAFNIGKNTIFGKITSVRDERTGKFLMSGQEHNQFLQTIQTSSITFGEKLYGLPSIDQILSTFEQEIEKIAD